MKKFIIALSFILLIGCGHKIVKESECIAKPPLPSIELGRLIFPKFNGNISIDSESQSICLPIDNFIQVLDNNKNIEFYIKRCKLIKDTYESYYEIPQDIKEIK